MKQVPLSGRVIFSDWHGVLSRDPFWVSIRSSVTHPLCRQLEAGMAGVFASDRDIANEWMKGLLSSDQVIAEMGIQLDRRFKEDFLARRLDVDCARMKVNAELFEVLRAMLAEAMVVIATDNMDCFARDGHQRHRRRRQPAQTLAGHGIAVMLLSRNPTVTRAEFTVIGVASRAPCASCGGGHASGARVPRRATAR